MLTDDDLKTSELPYRLMNTGIEQQPAVIIDNFMPNPAGLVDYALSRGDVRPAPGFYPGLRSPTPPVYNKLLCQQLRPLLSSCFGLTEGDPQQIESWYSLVATPVDQLSPWQQIPHFDRPEPQDLAVLHYLCRPPHGGTSFYRHRETGFEYIDCNRKPRYLASIESALADPQRAVAPAYINGNTDLFEQIVSIDCVFNRALVYRCSSLHSGNIPADFSFDLDPRSGRFTIASFLTFAAET